MAACSGHFEEAGIVSTRVHGARRSRQSESPFIAEAASTCRVNDANPDRMLVYQPDPPCLFLLGGPFCGLLRLELTASWT